MKKKHKRKKKKQGEKRTRGDGNYSERVRFKFKLGFLQLICKTSPIFKSNLELALSIILKERIIRVKACCPL